MHRERKGRDNCLIFAILNRMVGAGLPEKVTIEERLLGGAGSESCRYEREENSREMKGFGGTDFRPVFKRVQEIIETEHAEVDFLVYFSDGYGNFPKEEPAYPVFFVLSEEEENVRLPDWVMPVWYRNM